MNSEWASWLSRWSDAGLIDAATADRIRAFEQEGAGQRRLRWPILVALAFGALMLGGGVLLFVAAHWDALSPAQRFSIVLLMVGGFHAGGAATADRFPAMSVTLHAIGSVALGAGIALSGQIFHLDEHWPGGVMLWALGAGLAWWLLRDTPQMVLFAVLAPAWLGAEWIAATADTPGEGVQRVLATGVLLQALTYFTAAGAGRPGENRRALVWVGGLALPPAAIAAVFAASSEWHRGAAPSAMLLATGTAVSIGIPLAVAWWLRRSAAWPNAAAAGWVLVLFWIAGLAAELPLYGWWAVGAVGLVAWGLRDGRTERINMGAAVFAATVFAFYFSEVMDKLGRSASLIGLGLLFLGGGWALERLRRRLVDQARGGA
jgi:uncharacterized membrane protein